MKKPADIGSYIAGFPPGTQLVLEQVRGIIHKAAPKAEECISYAIPAFRLNERGLVYFAGYKEHLGLYPVPKGDAALLKAIETYQTGKGTLQFPLERKLPTALITKVVKQLVKENIERVKSRKKK